MDVKQIYEFVNYATQEALGSEAIVKEDLSNIVDIGKAVLDANAMDKYVGALVDRIGKTIFVDRVYTGHVPSVMKTGWEFGAILQKVQCELPDAQENESWSLTDGESYDPFIFKKPVISANYKDKKVTFEIQLSFVEKQANSAFTSASEKAAFVAMIYTWVKNSLTKKLDELIMRTLNNMIGETVYDDYAGASISGSSKTKAVNLLYLYNQRYGESLTAANCCTDPDFIRFACNIMKMYADRMADITTIYNIDGKARFTPADALHVVLLSEFEAGSMAYVESDTFHKELIALPKHETVAKWQGNGGDYALSNAGKVYVKTASGHDVQVTGVLGVMFDDNAIAVANVDERTKSIYNPKGEFYNNFWKVDASYFNSTDENFVVFFAA